MFLHSVAIALANLIAGDPPAGRAGPTLVLCPMRERALVFEWAKVCFGSKTGDVIGLTKTETTPDEIKKFGLKHNRRIQRLFLFGGGQAENGSVKIADDNQQFHVHTVPAARLGGTTIDEIEIATAAGCTPSKLGRIVEAWHVKQAASYNLQRLTMMSRVDFGAKKLSKSESETEAEKLGRVFRAALDKRTSAFLVPGMPRSVSELAKALEGKRSFTFVWEWFTAERIWPGSGNFQPGVREGDPVSIPGVPLSDADALPVVDLKVAEALTMLPNGNFKHDSVYCPDSSEPRQLRRVIVRA